MDRIMEAILSIGAEYYLIAFLVVFVITIIVHVRCNLIIKKYSDEFNCLGMTGEEVARAVLDAYDIYDVDVIMGNHANADSYNHRNKVIKLSPEVFGESSVSAIGIAAHEAGHAIQHSKKYLPNMLRSFFAPVAAIGSQYSVLIVFIGVAINAFASSTSIGYYVALAGFVFYLFAVAFSLVTLPVELNASRRARVILADEFGFIDEDIKGVRKVLSACALTYVAGLVSAIITLLRMISIISKFRRD